LHLQKQKNSVFLTKTSFACRYKERKKHAI
jgi:hypothetical protein